MKPIRDGKRKHIISKSSKTRKGAIKRTPSPQPLQQKFQPIPRLEPKIIKSPEVPSTFSKYNNTVFI